MNLELKKHITTYFNEVFIEGVRSFEQLIINFTSSSRMKDNFKIQLSNVVRDSKNDFKAKQASQLVFGKNQNAEVSFYVLRVIWNSFYTFIFSASRLPIQEIDDLFCIVVETPEMEGPFSEAWKKELGPMSTLLIKQPVLQLELFNNLKIVRILIENIFIKKPSIFRADPNEVKTKGNQYFKNGDYISALNYYQYSLACSFVQSESDINFRAILYSNSAATLFKLNFYDCSLVYCSISNFLDKEYVKVNVWKIKCLLEKKMFGDIPNLLVVLQKSNADYFTTVNSKFAIYLSNSLSMYNWKAVCQQIMKKDEQQINIADYMSRSVGVMIENEKERYYALQNIKKDSILIIKKPAILEKKGSKINEKLSDKIVKFLKLQKSSNHYNIRNAWSQYQSIETNTQINTQKHIHKIFSQFITAVRDITSNQSQSLGYWPQILKFSHSCDPNCSYAHFESILIASTCSNIEKGQPLSIDYALQQSPQMRKSYLQNSYGIVCSCQYCEKGLLYTKNAKQDFWNIISSAYGQIEASLLESESEKFQDSINWNDLVISFRLLRQGIKFQNILMKILQRGLKNLLKIPESNAKQLIDILK